MFLLFTYCIFCIAYFCTSASCGE